jgi:hypothetical protein
MPPPLPLGTGLYFKIMPKFDKYYYCKQTVTKIM